MTDDQVMTVPTLKALCSWIPTSERFFLVQTNSECMLGHLRPRAPPRVIHIVCVAVSSCVLRQQDRFISHRIELGNAVESGNRDRTNEYLLACLDEPVAVALIACCDMSSIPLPLPHYHGASLDAAPSTSPASLSHSTLRPEPHQSHPKTHCALIHHFASSSWTVASTSFPIPSNTS